MKGFKRANIHDTVSPFSTPSPKFQFVARIVSEKTLIQIFNVLELEKKKKRTNKWIINASNLILDPRVHEFFVHHFTKFENSYRNGFWENCDINFHVWNWRERKMDRKKRYIRPCIPILYPMIQQLTVHLFKNDQVCRLKTLILRKLWYTFCIVWKVERENMDKNRMIISLHPNSQSHDTRTHCPILYKVWCLNTSWKKLRH